MCSSPCFVVNAVIDVHSGGVKGKHDHTWVVISVSSIGVGLVPWILILVGPRWCVLLARSLLQLAKRLT